MNIYRVADYARMIEGQPAAHNNTLYFLDRERALTEGDRLARIYAVMNDCELARNDVNQYGILTVWCDRWPDPNYEVRVEEGTVEDA